jgi:hypothetical protein
VERGIGLNCFGGDTTAVVKAIGGAKEGAALVTAETAPHGPSHSAIMAAHESNAMPMGPRITQAVSTANISQRERPSVMALMVARGARIACPRPTPSPHPL